MCGWTVSYTHLDVYKRQLQVEQAGFEKTYERLVSWEQEQELKFYSGTGRYIKKIQIATDQWEQMEHAATVVLRLEHIGETAEIRILSLIHI